MQATPKAYGTVELYIDAEMDVLKLQIKKV
jgi:hypothetical protein